MCSCPAHPEATTAADVQSALFTVEDMTCSHCAGAIRDALKAGMPGTNFSVDLETQRVAVDGDPTIAAAVIREAGYEPVLLTDR